MVHIIHVRKRDAAGNVLARGGMTLAISEDGTQVGVAVCSERDNYSKRPEDDGQVWARARLWLLTGGEPPDVLPFKAQLAGINAAENGQDFNAAVRMHIARRSLVFPGTGDAVPRGGLALDDWKPITMARDAYRLRLEARASAAGTSAP